MLPSLPVVGLRLPLVDQLFLKLWSGVDRLCCWTWVPSLRVWLRTCVDEDLAPAPGDALEWWPPPWLLPPRATAAPATMVEIRATTITISTFGFMVCPLVVERSALLVAVFLLVPHCLVPHVALMRRRCFRVESGLAPIVQIGLRLPALCLPFTARSRYRGRARSRRVLLVQSTSCLQVFAGL